MARLLPSTCCPRRVTYESRSTIKLSYVVVDPVPLRIISGAPRRGRGASALDAAGGDEGKWMVLTPGGLKEGEMISY